MIYFISGASSYHPTPNEHIVLAYFTLDMFKDFETCGGKEHDLMNISVSVHNMVSNVNFMNMSYKTETKMNATLIDILKELNRTNENFGYV